MEDKHQKIKKLEALAAEILILKQELGLRRPLLIEFCGTPKAGKTTTITSLNIFLKRNEFKTVVLSEKASVCPIDKKTHPFFNLWTFSKSVADILEHLFTGKDLVDIILVDRGIFDALCWFEWLITNPPHNPHLDLSNHKSMIPFITMKMFTSYIDLIYVFQVSPETALEREYATLLTEKYGSIMKPEVIESYNFAINNCIDKYSKIFRKIQTIETSNDEPNNISYLVTSKILEILKETLIEKIGYLDTSYKSRFNNGINNFEVIADAELKFGSRKFVENSDFIQPIPIAVITNPAKDKVLVVKKNLKKSGKGSPEKNKYLLYVGGHIRQEDYYGNLMDIFGTALYREVNEEIAESISVAGKEPFLIYKPTNQKSEKHLAICYVIIMDLEDKKFNPSGNEFVSKTGRTKSGQVLTIKELLDESIISEEWSIEILKKVFNVTSAIKQGKFEFDDSFDDD